MRSIAQAIEMIPLMTYIRESGLTYPILMSLHLTMIALFGGMILLTDLRLLGVALKDYTVTEVVKGLRPFKHAGLTIMVTLGLLLGTAEMTKYYDNPYFMAKMTLLLLAAVHAIVFRKSVYRNTEELDKSPVPTSSAKLAAITSLLMWTTIACMGRLIAYYEPPK